MKQKLMLAALLAAALLALSGCGKKNDSPAPQPPAQQNTEVTPPAEAPTQPESPEETEDAYAHFYDEVLDEYYYAISTGFEDSEPDGSTGVWEASMGMDSREALSAIGCTISDISGDGVPELIIARINDMDSDRYYGSEVLSIFSCAEDAPVCILEGWARNRYSWLGNGSFSHYGSAGYRDYATGLFTIAEDGSCMICDELYFASGRDDSDGIDYYYNTTGFWDPATSELLTDFTNEDFWTISDGYDHLIEPMELTPFSDLWQLPVQAYWADEVSFPDYDTFTVDTSEYQSCVYFAADETVRNFRLLALNMVDVDEMGLPTYEAETLHTQSALTPERPLAVKLTFYGDLPAYGISYEDSEGLLRSFALYVSGRDGSLLLDEFRQ